MRKGLLLLAALSSLAWNRERATTFARLPAGTSYPEGLTVDLNGDVYIADFGDLVWKITPDGERRVFASGLYGASGNAIDNQGNADCETGQRGYPKKLNHFDSLGRNLATDQHTPGDQGPTFHGRPRVPAGETFSRNPTTGPQTPFNPSNP